MLSGFIRFLEFSFLLRVPILIGLAVAALPLLAFKTPLKSLLRGLFDVSPLDMVAITLAATTAAETVANNARIIYGHSASRLGVAAPFDGSVPPAWFWVGITLVVCLPVTATALLFSAKQNGGAGKLLLTTVPTFVVAAFLPDAVAPLFRNATGGANQLFAALGKGYADGAADHVSAAVGFGIAFLFYLALGAWGYMHLGKSQVVPALCSVLMVLMLLCSFFSAVSFLLDVWHIPALLVAVAMGVFGALSKQSDHYYDLKDRVEPTIPAPTPAEIAGRAGPGARIILVAANGGGIQAAAWTAQVLEGLGKEAIGFRDSLRLISSVSGGSVGTAFYLYSLEKGPAARPASEAAALSSIEEVAWGLAWPDLFRTVLPQLAGNLVGRGRAIEIAWCLNASPDRTPRSELDNPLSGWNDKVRTGELPAVVMNATIVETGQRLLFGTTSLDSKTAPANARVDAADLHVVNGMSKDVGIVTAARLSATFPYVTPASRSRTKNPTPHIVDGGYYDNYGMSTLVEWLDEALSQSEVGSVLVLQLHGAPVGSAKTAGQVPVGAKKDRGWFYQAYAPLAALSEVRSAGQIAHNNLELQQLQQKWWAIRKVPIHSLTFEFPGKDAPLSWHLTAAEAKAIREEWQGSEMDSCRQKVKRFLAREDSLGCGCPACHAPRGVPQVAR